MFGYGRGIVNAEKLYLPPNYKEGLSTWEALREVGSLTAGTPHT